MITRMRMLCAHGECALHTRPTRIPPKRAAACCPLFASSSLRRAQRASTKRAARDSALADGQRNISESREMRARLGLLIRASHQGFSLELVSVAVWVLKQVGLEGVLVEERGVVTLDGSRERDIPGRGYQGEGGGRGRRAREEGENSFVKMVAVNLLATTLLVDGGPSEDLPQARLP